MHLGSLWVGVGAQLLNVLRRPHRALWALVECLWGPVGLSSAILVGSFMGAQGFKANPLFITGEIFSDIVGDLLFNVFLISIFLI